MKDSRSLFPVKVLMVITGTALLFSVTLPELSVSVTAPPLCSPRRVNRLHVKLCQRHHHCYQCFCCETFYSHAAHECFCTAGLLLVADVGETLAFMLTLKRYRAVP